MKRLELCATAVVVAITFSLSPLFAAPATPRALNANDYNVNTAWTMADEITTERTTNGRGFATGTAQIGDVNVTAKFEKFPGSDDGASSLSDQGENQASYAATAEMFYENPDPATIPALGISMQPSSAANEANLQQKLNRNGTEEVGTLTFQFDKAVTDPIFDLSGIGGYAYQIGTVWHNRAWRFVGRG